MTLEQKNIDRYKMIFELSPEAIVILDIKGKVLDTNNRIYEWLGYEITEVVGKSFFKMPFFSKLSLLKASEKFAQRMLGKKIEPYDLDFIDKKGHKKIGLITAVPIRDEKKKIIEDMIMITDVTERRVAEEKLEDKLEEMKKMNRMMIGRELVMVKLKEQIKKLEARK